MGFYKTFYDIMNTIQLPPQFLLQKVSILVSSYNTNDLMLRISLDSIIKQGILHLSCLINDGLILQHY